LRVRHRASWRDGAIAGCGIAILANSRPLEGAILTILCFIWMIAMGRKRRCGPVIASLAIVLAISGAWIAYYNWRVTGSATTLPYSLYEEQYAPTRPLAWLPPPASQPSYRISAMREFYLNWELPNYHRQRSIGGFISASLGKLWVIVKGFGRAPTLALTFIGLPIALQRWRWTRTAAIVVVLCVLNALPVLTYFPHYSAPVVPLLVLVVTACACAIRRARRPIVLIILVGQAAALGHWVIRRAQTDITGWNYLRQAFVAQQTAEQRKSLVFVRADPGYYVHNEYVYNAANIDAQVVVWARDLGAMRNRELIEYYKNRGEDRELLLLDNGRQMLPYNDRE